MRHCDILSIVVTTNGTPILLHNFSAEFWGYLGSYDQRLVISWRRKRNEGDGSALPEAESNRIRAHSKR